MAKITTPEAVYAAKIGKKIREVEVQPVVEPDPTYVPVEPPAPVPDKVPAEACSTM